MMEKGLSSELVNQMKGDQERFNMLETTYKKYQLEKRENERKAREAATGRKEEIKYDDETREKKSKRIIDCASKAVVSHLQPYVDMTRLQVLQAEIELMSGNEKTNSEAYAVLTEMKGIHFLNQWKDEVVLDFEKK